jgi:hypothetical protein
VQFAQARAAKDYRVPEYWVRTSPSIAPLDRLNRHLYLVLEDFGSRAGFNRERTRHRQPPAESWLFLNAGNTN